MAEFCPKAYFHSWIKENKETTYRSYPYGPMTRNHEVKRTIIRWVEKTCKFCGKVKKEQRSQL